MAQAIYDTGVASSGGTGLIDTIVNETTSSGRTQEISPISTHNNSEKLFNATSQAAGTYEKYIDMEDFRKLGIQLILGAGALTLTTEVCVQNDGTEASSCTFEDKTSEIFGVANLTASDVLIDNAEAMAVIKYVKIKIVSTVTSTYEVHVTKLY